jgi:hypothetical protein
VRARGEVARDDHDFAERLVDGVIEPVPRSMAAKFEVEVGEPGKTLYVIGHGGFPEFLWGFSIIMMMMAEERAAKRHAKNRSQISNGPEKGL